MRQLIQVLGAALALALAASALAAPRAVSFSGRVVDVAGKPVGEATVYVVLFNGTRFHDDLPPPPALQRKTAPADGTFRIELPLEGPPWGAQLFAVKDGLAPGGLFVSPEMRQSGLELTLLPASFVEGRVVDRAGRPVAGAKVGVGWGDRYDVEPVIALPEAVRPTVTTDAQGRFRLTTLPTHSRVLLTVEHPDYERQPSRQPDIIASGRKDVTVVLNPAARIEGRVLGEDGAPAAGVRVRCIPGGPWLRPQVTDAAGRYRFTGLASGLYTLHAERPPRADSVAEPRSVSVKEGEQARCPDLQLERLAEAGEVSGRVTAVETGQPIAEAGLRFIQMSDRPRGGGVRRTLDGRTARTDAQGRYRVRLPTGRWSMFVEFWPPGYVPERSRPGPGPITLAAGDKATRDLQLRKPAELRGKVVDGAGRPVANARLRASSPGLLRSDREGRFLLRPISPPSEEVRLGVIGPTGGQGAYLRVVPARQRRELVVRLRPLPKVTGQVKDEKGVPISGAWVRADQVVRTPEGSGWSEERGPAVGTITDAAGRYSLAVYPGATFALVAEADGYTTEEQQNVSVEAGKPVAPRSFTLARADGVLAGVVVDEAGRPLAGASVAAWRDQGPESRQLGGTATNGEGRFRIEKLPQGEVLIGVHLEGYMSTRSTIARVGADDLRVVMAPFRAPPDGPPQLGQPAPEIQAARWVNGEGVPSLKALRGKTVVLQFSSAENPAANATNAALKALHAALAAARREDVVILGFYDGSFPAEDVADYARREALPFPIGLGEPGTDGPTFEAYGVDLLPSLFVINGQGIIRAVDPSPEELSRLVAAKEGSGKM